MAVPIHKTGLNKTLGQKSSAIVSADLIGNFIPSQGISSSSWTNQAASNALRRYNGITYVNIAPRAFQFDGIDDYLGEASSGYGGNPFNVAFQNAYTIGQWVYLPNTWSSGKIHILFYFFHDSSNYVMFQIDGSVVEIHSFTSSGNLANLSISPNFNPRSERDKWVYYTITHSSGTYKFFANGTFVGRQSTFAPTATAKPMTVGRYGSSYTSAGVNVGHIHVYSSALTNSQIRQNYLAIASPVNTRHYGETAL
tara:strand:- start:12261 stop:13019 length:759 start_codon:yes stop_codon:yes gene_type:complete